MDVIKICYTVFRYKFIYINFNNKYLFSFRQTIDFKLLVCLNV